MAISQGVAAALARGGVPPQRIRIIPSGVDPERVAHGNAQAARASLALDATTPMVLNAAALVDHKDQATLLKAWAKVEAEHATATLVIAGDGERHADLTEQAAQLGLQRCHFVGWRSDIPDLLAAADLFCMSSVEEGLGTSIIDAMLARTPVVATRAGGIPELIAPGTGWLSPVSDPTALAESLLAALAEPDQRAACAAGRLRSRYDHLYRSANGCSLPGLLSRVTWEACMSTTGLFVAADALTHSADRGVLLPGVAEVLGRLAARSVPVIAVGSGPSRDGVAVHLACDDAGVPLAEVAWADDNASAAMQLPRPGLILRAAQNHGLDIFSSWVASPDLALVEAGSQAGCVGAVLLGTALNLPLTL